MVWTSFWAVSGKDPSGRLPLGRCAGPVRQGNLGEIESPEGGDLAGAEPSDVGLVVDQELLELIDGRFCRSHASNISSRYDKKR